MAGQRENVDAEGVQTGPTFAGQLQVDEPTISPVLHLVYICCGYFRGAKMVEDRSEVKKVG